MCNITVFCTLSRQFVRFGFPGLHGFGAFVLLCVRMLAEPCVHISCCLESGWGVPCCQATLKSVIGNRKETENQNRESTNQRKQVLQIQCMWKMIVRTFTFLVRALESKGLFKWRKGALPNLATWLEGLIHSLPLYATHLTGTVSGLLELSFESPLSTTNKNGRPKKLFSSYFSFPHRYRPVLCLKLVYHIVLFRLTVILFGR